MSHSAMRRNPISARRLGQAALMALGLIVSAPAIQEAPAFAAEPGATGSAETDTQKSTDKFDMRALKERLRELGEAFREAIEDATQALNQDEEMDPAAGRGGLGGLAPNMRGRDVRAVYGPKGPTLQSVEALLNYRLVLLGNERLTAGRIFERDTRIIAEIVTAKEKALVARYLINKETGVWVPEL